MGDNLESNSNSRYYYEGYYYSFSASGGYVGYQDAPAIKYSLNAIFEKFDMTDAVQVLFDVRTFNEKMGIIKDTSNSAIIDSSFNVQTNEFPVDSISLEAGEFVDGMSENQVISVGRYSTLYSDFESYIHTYFGNSGGFASLFAGASTYSINNGVFDPSAFIKMITASPLNGSGAYTEDLSGSITVSNINNLLKVACTSNVFGNRDASANKSMEDGFISGDLIFIPNGTDFALNVNIDTEGFIPPLNNYGVDNVDISNQDVNYVSPNQLFSSNSSATLTSISRRVTAPLLIRLANLPDEVITDYQEPTNLDKGNSPYHWINRGHDYGNRQWTCVSLSSNGRYQTIGEYEGSLYRSEDYGITWNTVLPNYNNNLWSCVAVSDSGEHQTACGYNSYIFESTDYGNTWIPTGTKRAWSSVSICATGQYQTALIVNGTINISSDHGNTWVPTALNYGKKDWKWVSISATGQYQGVVSYNDGIYESTNFGDTWTKTYPSAQPWISISISATGQYQTACVDNGGIYISANYGNSWQMNTDLGNRLWSCVSISGTGQYQSVLSRFENIYMSSDYGNSWVSGTNDIYYKPWSAIAVSFSGNFQTSLVWNGSIYLSKLF